MKILSIAIALGLSACGDLRPTKTTEETSDSSAYAYGECGRNRIFATYYGSGVACVYTRPGTNCHDDPTDLDTLTEFVIPTEKLRSALNHDVGPNAFIDLENEDVMATVNIDTIRSIKRAVKRVEAQSKADLESMLRKEAIEYCTSSGRLPNEPGAVACIEGFIYQRTQMRTRCH